MKTHSFFSHTPEEMRRRSNLGHIAEGILLAIGGVLALLNSAGLGWAVGAWQIVILVAGILLLFLLYPLHPVSEWRFIWRDPQQRQHTLIAIALIVAGGALLTTLAALQYVWPVVLVFIGALFILHTQHGQGEAVHQAMLRHRVLGITIIAAGVLRLLEMFTGSNAFAVIYALALLAAAVQLLLYREPPGAFEIESHHEG